MILFYRKFFNVIIWYYITKNWFSYIVKLIPIFNYVFSFLENEMHLLFLMSADIKTIKWKYLKQLYQRILYQLYVPDINAPI